MTKRINVNPGQYKVAGREHTGNAVAKAPQPEAVNRGNERAPDRNKKKRMKSER